MAHIGVITPDAVLAQLKTELDPLLPTFVLVDPMLGEPTPELVEAANACADLYALNDERSRVWKGAVFALRLDESIVLEPHRYPYLVSADPSAQALAESVRIACEERSRALACGLAPYRIGGWLQSAADPALLCLEIARLCRLRTQGNAAWPARYLRLADRRVLAMLRHVMGEAPIGSRLPSLGQWLWLDDGGSLERLLRIDPVRDDPFVISSPAWARLALGADIHPVRARWLGMAKNARADFDRIERALAHAETMRAKWPARFRGGADGQAWALLSLLFGDLSGRPEIEALLERGDPEYPEGPGEPAEAFHLLFDAAFEAAVRMQQDVQQSPIREEHP